MSYKAHIALGPCQHGDPSPMTVAGTRALVERYYAIKGTEVGAGGARGRGVTTSHSPLPTLKPKRLEIL